MNEAHFEKIAAELKLKPDQVVNTAALLGEDATVPFIARYRKEKTGSLDEVQITAIRDRLAQLAELGKRRKAILTSLTDRELLTDELKKKVEGAETLAVLEDIYLPYRPKRRTRATVAKEKGLEPLAEKIFAQTGIDPTKEAEAFVTPAAELEKLEEKEREKKVANVEGALAGARDIIAEWINENVGIRARMRSLFMKKGVIASAVVDKDKKGADTYKDYFELSEPVGKAPSHRVLAIFRGEREGHLRASIAPPEAEALPILTKTFIKGDGPDSEQVQQALEDSYKRLLSPSMETEVRAELKRRADETAIGVFCENVRELLLAAPFGERSVLAIDPGYRTGCKVACLDKQGSFLETATVYLTSSAAKREEATKKLKELIEKHKPEAVAIGNGTASRETETFVRGLELSDETIIVLVNESGASVYSASAVARKEFPDQDVTVRGAVSIGRRLMDPLAELVKIDPKSIGVGQYQHDVDQKKLKQGLDDVVGSCVNNVGVDVNTASPQLLGYVSGMGPQLAGNIVKHRQEKGAFDTRAKLLDVPRLGAKAYEQAAGFLRIRDGENPLDASAVHPERYEIVEKMAADLSMTIAELISDASVREKIDLKNYATDDVGLPTLNDIMAELAKPGRDPREAFEAFSFAPGIEKISDLEVGAKLPGIVTNVTDFGAFVDVGVHQDGLVHISHIADRFVKNPGDVAKVGQKVTITVIGVEAERKRISLSMRKDPFAPPPKREKQPPRPKKGRKPPAGQQRTAKPKPPPRPEPKRFSNNPFADLKNLKKKK